MKESGLCLTFLLENTEMILMENKNTEARLTKALKEKEKIDRFLLSLEWVVGILSCLVLFIPIFIASSPLPMNDFQRIVLCLIGIIPFITGIFFAVKIEQLAGYYECKKCKHKYVPEFKDVILATHMGRTRYLKCPRCQKKSWHKKVISKDN